MKESQSFSHVDYLIDIDFWNLANMYLSWRVMQKWKEHQSRQNNIIVNKSTMRVGGCFRCGNKCGYWYWKFEKLFSYNGLDLGPYYPWLHQCIYFLIDTINNRPSCKNLIYHKKITETFTSNSEFILILKKSIKHRTRRKNSTFK